MAYSDVAAGPINSLQIPTASDVGYTKGDATVSCDGDTTLGHVDQIPFPITAKTTKKEFGLSATVAECTAAMLALAWDSDFSTDTVDPTTQAITMTSDGPSFVFSNAVLTDPGTLTIPGGGDVITLGVGFKFLYAGVAFIVVS